MRLISANDERHEVRNRPRAFADGEPIAAFTKSEAATNAEGALTWSLIAKRREFGQAYMALQPDYFWEMPNPSGVFIGAMVPTRLIFPGATQPGDIDLMIIPYERNQLLLSRAMAVEVKVIRASFAKPGKSPNDFGFSQARALLKLGIPQVAVMHLIVSDQSPTTHWRKYMTCRIVGPNDEAELIGDVLSDPLPIELMERAFGRLTANCADANIGLIAQFVPHVTDDSGRGYFPLGRAARPNPHADAVAMSRIAAFFDRYWRGFVDTPRFDPK